MLLMHAAHGVEGVKVGPTEDGMSVMGHMKARLDRMHAKNMAGARDAGGSYGAEARPFSPLFVMRMLIHGKERIYECIKTFIGYLTCT